MGSAHTFHLQLFCSITNKHKKGKAGCKHIFRCKANKQKRRNEELHVSHAEFFCRLNLEQPVYEIINVWLIQSKQSYCAVRSSICNININIDICCRPLFQVHFLFLLFACSLGSFEFIPEYLINFLLAADRCLRQNHVQIQWSISHTYRIMEYMMV